MSDIQDLKNEVEAFISSCRNRAGKNTISKLSAEFLDASKNIGSAIRKKEEINRMAEANKAFAKYKS